MNELAANIQQGMQWLINEWTLKKERTALLPGDAIRSNFIRSTSLFDRRFQVEIEDCTLGHHNLTWVLMLTLNIKDQALSQNFTFDKLYWLLCLKSTKKIQFIFYKADIAKIMNVKFKTQVIFCQPKSQSSMLTLRPTSICVNICKVQFLCRPLKF